MKKLLLLSLICSAIIASDEPAAAAAQETKPTLALLKTLVGHADIIWSVKFSPKQANLLASASSDKTVKLWDVNSGQCLQTLGNSINRDGVCSVAFSSDNKLAMGTWDNSIKLFDLETGKCINMLPTLGSVADLDYSPDGNQLISGLRLHYQCSPGRVGGACHLWDVRTMYGDTLYGWNNIGMEPRVAYMNDGVHAMVVSNGGIYKMDCVTHEKISNKIYPVFADASLSADNKMIYVVDQQTKLMQCDTTNCQLIKEFKLDNKATAIAVTADSKYVVIGCEDGFLRLLDPVSGDIVAQVQDFSGSSEAWGNIVYSVSSAPQNNLIAAASANNNDIKINSLQ